MRKTLKYSLIVIIMIFSVALKSNENNNVMCESRVIFDERFNWALSKRNTMEVLKRIKKAGFNTYIVNVWHGKGTYYKTKQAYVFDNDILKRRLSYEDPLEYLIKQAHRLGIEVHPWFTVVKRESKKYKQFYDEGTPPGAFNVHNKEFRQFIVKLILEVVDNYNIDGVNLDYIRTMGICKSKLCVNEYKKKYKHSLIDDIKLIYKDKDARKRIEIWQDDSIEEIIRELSKKIRVKKKNIVISIDGQPFPSSMKRPLQGRNSIKWIQNKWIDVIYNMDYRKEFDHERFSLAYNEVGYNSQMIFLFGNYDRVSKKAVSRDESIVNNFIEFSRAKWNNRGIGIYLYSTLSTKQIVKLKSNVFSIPAKPCWIGKK